jgi:hypothetical protein
MLDLLLESANILSMFAIDQSIMLEANNLLPAQVSTERGIDANPSTVQCDSP